MEKNKSAYLDTVRLKIRIQVFFKKKKINDKFPLWRNLIGCRQRLSEASGTMWSWKLGRYIVI